MVGGFPEQVGGYVPVLWTDFKTFGGPQLLTPPCTWTNTRGPALRIARKNRSCNNHLKLRPYPGSSTVKPPGERRWGLARTRPNREDYISVGWLADIAQYQ